MKYSWLTGVIGLSLAIALTLHALRQEQQITIEATHLRLSEAIDQAELDLTRSLAGMAQMFLGFQHYLELTQQQPEPDDASLRRTMDTLVLNDDYLVSLVVADQDGQIQHWTNSGPKPNIRQREYFDIHTTSKTDGINLSPPLPSLMSPGQWIIGASQAIRHPDGSLDRVLIGIIDARRLFRRLEEMRGGTDMALTVLSPNGLIYARSPDHDQMVGTRHPELLPGRQPTLERQDSTDRVSDESTQLVLWRQLPCCRLVLRAETTSAAAMPSRQSEYVLLLAAGTGIVLVVAWQLARLLRLGRQKRELNRQLRSAQQRDPLTGLPLWSATPENVRSATLLKPPLAMILIGLDLYPHLIAEQDESAGAALIVRSAETLAQFATDTTQLSRYLCSRFILLLPNTDQELAMMTAEQIRTALGSEVFDEQMSRRQSSASLGVSLWDVTEADLEATLKRATTALATAAKRGGNQVCLLSARENWLERKS